MSGGIFYFYLLLIAFYTYSLALFHAGNSHLMKWRIIILFGINIIPTLHNRLLL